jgi:hypothetical protein
MDSFWYNRTQDYSIVVQGALRFEHSSYYNLTFHTNLDIKVYIEDELVLTKANMQRQAIPLLNRYFDKGKLHKIEVFCTDNSLYQEKLLMVTNSQAHTSLSYINAGVQQSFDWRQKQSFGYLEVFESSPFQESRIIMPKNMFLLVPADDQSSHVNIT